MGPQQGIVEAHLREKGILAVLAKPSHCPFVPVPDVRHFPVEQRERFVHTVGIPLIKVVRRVENDHEGVRDPQIGFVLPAGPIGDPGMLVAPFELGHPNSPEAIGFIRSCSR